MIKVCSKVNGFKTKDLYISMFIIYIGVEMNRMVKSKIAKVCKKFNYKFEINDKANEVVVYGKSVKVKTKTYRYATSLLIGDMMDLNLFVYTIYSSSNTLEIGFKPIKVCSRWNLWNLIKH